MGEKETPMKTDFLKVLAGVLVIALVVSAFGGDTASDKLSPILTLVLIVVALSVTDERISELVKMVLRFAFGNVDFLKFLQPSGTGSAVLAAVVAYAGINHFDVEIFKEFPAFASLDGELVSLMTIALTWIGAGVTHNLLPAGVGKAQPVK